MIQTVIHLSDIHIRAGNKELSRYDEYHCVFERTIASIKEQPSIINKSAVIVITGDMFHHKNKMEPCSLELALQLLKGLASLARVFIIRGNHDYRQDVPNEPDTIRALMSYDIPNVTYLDKTGIHTFHNISFGLVAIQDTLLYGATAGINGNLPPYPEPLKESEYNIALFHGSITGSALQNSTMMRDGYPISWFKDYDAILLGDIHLQQIHRSQPVEFKSDSLPHSVLTSVHEYTKEPWGYPGSLIQQDFGETLGHGYLVWNLNQKQIKSYHIHNPYGFVKVRVGDTIEIKYQDRYHPFQIVSEPWFPIHLKVNVGNVSSETVRMVTEQLQSHGKKIVTIKQYEVLPVVSVETKSDILDINSLDSMIDYIQNIMSNQERIIPSVWKSWLKHPETLLIPHDTLPDKVAVKIADKSEKIHKSISKYLEEFDKVTSQISHGQFHIHNLDWNWILNFKNNNHFDFDKTNNQIAILNAKNGFGKSNFLEIVCIAIFGEGFPSRTSKQYSAGIICDKKPKGVMANTTITFTLLDNKYKLHRVMRPNSDQRSINFEKIILYNIDCLGREIILHQQKNAVHSWIETNIGSIDTYLMTAMLSQNSDKDFFSLEKSTQKELLDRILSLQHITTFQLLLKDAAKYYKSAYELIESFTDGIISKPLDPKTILDLEQNRTLLQTVSDRVSHLHSQWNFVSEYDLIQLNDDSKQRLQILSEQISKYNLPNHLSETISKYDLEIQKWETILNEFYTFSDLHTSFNTVPFSIEIYHELRNKIQYFKNNLDFHENHNLYFDFKNFSENDFPVSDVNPKLLFKIVSEFESWDYNKSSEFTDINESFHKINEISVLLGHHSKIVSESPPKISKLTKDLDKEKKRLTKLRKEKDLIQERRPNRPIRIPEWLQETEKTLKGFDLNQTIQKKDEYQIAFDKIPILCEKILNNDNDRIKLNTRIDACKNTPFNSDCYACKQQAWRIDYEEAVQELKEKDDLDLKLMTDLQNYCCLDIELQIDSYEEYKSIIKKELEIFTFKILLFEEFQKENTISELYLKWDKENQIVAKSYHDLDLSVTKQSKQLKDLESQLSASKLERMRCESLLQSISRKKEDFELYQSDRTERLKEVENAKEAIQRDWMYQLFQYRSHISQLLDMLQTEIVGLKEKRSFATEQLWMAQERDQLVLEESQLTKNLSVYPYWLEWKSEMETKKNLERTICELEFMIANGTVSDSKELQLKMGELREQSNLIEFISNTFVGYREWIYKERIAPMIQRRVNHVLALICDDRPLSLETEWLEKIDTLSWFIRDGTSRPIIEKASGFQRFICGIALRVAFHQLGVCRIGYDQLFIDEGFTSCDIDNLEKVPSFLSGLLRIYRSICLVTHLEELKHYSPTHIHISRDADGLSQIRFGHVSSEVSSEVFFSEKKKTGRPAKVTVTKI